MAQPLDELKSLGVNSIAIHPYAQIQNDGHVRFRNDDDFHHITVPLDWARERGLSVMLIPHIAYWGSKFLWRGEINFQTREEWDRFFGDYETWIVQMAKLAEAHGAQTFCIGLEFTHAQKFDARWRKIIAAIRQVYHGKLTYGGNWDSFQEVTFWDALDYVGVLAYFPLTKNPKPDRVRNCGRLEKQMPRTCQLLESARETRNSSLSRSATTAVRAPPPNRGLSRSAANTQKVQQTLYRCRTRPAATLSAIAGMYWWKWFPDLKPRNRELPDSKPEIKALIAKLGRATSRHQECSVGSGHCFS